MDVCVSAEREGLFLIACPEQMEWPARRDLVETFRAATAGQDVRGAIIDLHQVTHINSAGLGAIFALRRHLADIAAPLVVARPSVAISRLLTIVNLPALIPVVDTLDQARSRLDSIPRADTN